MLQKDHFKHLSPSMMGLIRKHSQIFSSFLFSFLSQELKYDLPIFLLFSPISIINWRTFPAQFGLGCLDCFPYFDAYWIRVRSLPGLVSNSLTRGSQGCCQKLGQAVKVKGWQKFPRLYTFPKICQRCPKASVSTLVIFF